MSEEEIIKERERIKDILNRKAQSLLEHRGSLSHSRHRRFLPLSEFNNFLEKLFFRIDNPDYVRIKDRIPENPSITQDS